MSQLERASVFTRKASFSFFRSFIRALPAMHQGGLRSGVDDRQPSRVRRCSAALGGVEAARGRPACRPGPSSMCIRA